MISLTTANPKKVMRDLGSSNSSIYLAAMSKFDIEPNFWCALEYFQKAGYDEVIDELFQTLAIRDNASRLVLPTIDVNRGLLHAYIPDSGIWADLVGFKPLYCEGASGAKTLLDYQYIYCAKNFLSMEGKTWATFRKNSRKFPRRFGEDRLFLSTDMPIDTLQKFASDALWVLKDESIYDFDVMVKYIFFGEHRLFTVDLETEKILGVSIWDENHQYINYRYCLCVDEPFLSEYIRLKFYLHMANNHENCNPKNKLINDGGILDRPGLRNFKDKLNPVKIDKIYTWR